MRLLALVTALVLTGIGFLVVENSSDADERTNKETRDLQERCYKNAMKWFQEKWGRGPIRGKDGSSTMIYFTSHYSQKLNKCFFWTETSYIPKDQTAAIVTKDLLDIHELNKVYAHCIFEQKDPRDPKELSLFSKKGETICFVAGVNCTSVSDWERLIEPYMEE